MSHIIQKQVLEVYLQERTNAFEMQQRVSDRYYEKVLPLIQKVFDEARDMGEVISINKLEIDIGAITESEFENGEWERLIYQKLSEVLQDLEYSGVKNVKKLLALSITEQWVFYMRSGFLPWNVLQINEDWYMAVLQGFAVDSTAIAELRKLLTNKNALKRIVFEHDDSFLVGLLETLTSQNQELLIGALGDIELIPPISSSSGFSKDTRKTLWVQVFQLVAFSKKLLRAPDIIHFLLGECFSMQQLKAKEFGSVLQKYEVDIETLEQRKFAMKKRKAGQNAEGNEGEEELNTTSGKSRTYKLTDDNSDEGIYIENAGIVLLHPFLSRFFRNLELIPENRFLNIESQWRAIFLLHYLATGRSEFKEYELVLPKMMCDFAPELPLELAFELTDTEAVEIENLLQSAMGQWEILQGTSVEGFRESFLQRRAKLSYQNGDILIRMEQNSIDVLLDYLPWNISMVKLPWMTNLIRVEWR